MCAWVHKFIRYSSLKIVLGGKKSRWLEKFQEFCFDFAPSNYKESCKTRRTFNEKKSIRAWISTLPCALGVINIQIIPFKNCSTAENINLISWTNIMLWVNFEVFHHRFSFSLNFSWYFLTAFTFFFSFLRSSFRVSKLAERNITKVIKLFLPSAHTEIGVVS